MGRRKRIKANQVRNKVTLPMARKIYELRNNLKYSFKQISRIVYCAPTTAFAALKRFDSATGKLLDRRIYNGRKNSRRKITTRVSRYLLDPQVL
jgi:hypothetical protein